MRPLVVVISFVSGLAFGWAANPVATKFYNMKSEYVTAAVIRKTADFIRVHQKWPSSWAELGDGDLSKYTHFDFTVKLHESDRYVIMRSINTRRGIWKTYPHYSDNMLALYSQIDLVRRGLTSH